MIEINPYNLKWAFKKLKTYYFYYHSSNYLKTKIINFEKALMDKKISFESISNDLKIFLENPFNRFSDYYHYGYLVYPKKNSFINSMGSAQISTEKTNYFIDLEIPLHLIDVLFCLEIIDALGEDVNSNNSLGGIIDNRIFKSKDIISNKFLFEDYKKGYQRWLNIPIASRKDDERPKIVIKTDIKSCFYNIKFNFNTFLSLLDISNSECSKIMKNIFNLYTSIISDKTLDSTKDYRMVVLPIGLLSSQIILNYLLRDLDEKIVNCEKVANYGRYVDDLIIVLNEKHFNNTSYSELLKNVFPDVFYELDGSIKIHRLKHLSKALDINLDKTIIKPLDSIDAFDDTNTRLFTEVSFCDYYDSERENSPAFFFKDYSSYDVRNILYDTISEGTSNAFSTIINCDAATILNCFSFWRDMLNKFKNNERKYSAITEKIENSIKCIVTTQNNEQDNRLIQMIKLTLIDELKAAKLLINDSNNAYYGYISQEDFLLLIKKSLNKEYEYAPMIFSVADISFYLAEQEYSDYSNHIVNTIELYKQINSIDDISGFDVNNFELTKDENLFKLSKKIILRKNKDSNKETIVALGALNMSKLEKYDVVFKTPPSYLIDDIFRIIKTAYANGAQYLLLPEFALDYEWILKVVKECRKRKISLISGVIHHKISPSKVANFTLIYDFYSGIVLLKPKNYMSPDEKALIKYKGPEGMGLDYYEPKDKFYFVINDGNICFSTMTCYEATNIVDRASLADKINVLFMPVYNYDTDYFNSIIDSLSRDISCFVLQANSNVMGDTKVRMPTSHSLADVARAKGGINNYCIIEKININNLLNSNNGFILNLFDINKGTVKPEIKKKEKTIKKLSAGNHSFK